MTIDDFSSWDLRDLEASLCRDSFADFVRLAWANSPRAATLGPLVWNWHLDAFCLHLEAVARGDLRNLLVNVPPGSTKTEVISVFFLPWVWTRNPGWRMIAASKIQPLADDASVKCREVIECEWYQETFVRGEWELRTDKNAKNDFANTLGGTRFATGVGGTVIGRHAHCILGDDLQDDKQSLGEWRATLEYWSGTLSSRALDPATVSKICVQQRLGKGDLSEAIIESKRFVHLCLPMRYGRGPAGTNVTRLPDGRELWRDPRTRPDELLNPRRYPEEQAQQEYVDKQMTYADGVGPHRYKAQFDQNPSDDEGGEISRRYWRFYQHPGYPATTRPAGCLTAEESPAVALPPAKKLAKILSMDTAVKEKESSDWSVAATLGVRGSDVFVLRLDRQKTDIVGLVRMLKAAIAADPDIRQKYVEDKSSGMQLLQLMKRGGDVGGVKFEPIAGLVAVDPGNVGKVERARIHTLPRVEAGQVYLPEGAPWTEDFVSEHAEFPSGTHDDQVDALSQGLSRVADTQRYAGIRDW